MPIINLSMNPIRLTSIALAALLCVQCLPVSGVNGQRSSAAVPDRDEAPPQLGVNLPPNYPFPQHTTYQTGIIQPSRYSQAQLDQHTSTFYFNWINHYLWQKGNEADGHPRYRISSGWSVYDATVSEGQGYGMLFTALMAGEDVDARKYFNGLYEFVIDHPTTNSQYLMDWYVPEHEGNDQWGNDSAFDGDCDIAYALLIAEKQWGNNTRFDYHAEAVNRISTLKTVIGPNSKLPMFGDWVDPYGSQWDEHSSRPSDFMIGHFRAFAIATGDSFWDDVIDACLIASAQVSQDFSLHPHLLPDFIMEQWSGATTYKPAYPYFLEGPNDGNYGWNALRYPIRYTGDAIFSGDTRTLQPMRDISLWIHNQTSGDPYGIAAGYDMNGAPIYGGPSYAPEFSCGFAVAAMTDPNMQIWMDDLYDTFYQSSLGYYSDSLVMLSMFLLNGNWWLPY
jgi:hypothetical protein